MKTLRDIGEDALIERLTRLVPLDPSPLAGPGDDCAVIDAGNDRLQLLKTDALVGGVHFLADAPPQKVGWKAVARVISDFAAMGGSPERFLITLALPPETEVSWVEDLYRGIADCLKRFGAVIAGGETCGVPLGSAPVISVAATGNVERDHLVLRSTARVGDVLFVTGRLGGSIHGKHLSFTPRLEESAWLVGSHKPTAMMDLSDGLAKDLPRMAAASGCGFRINRASVPVTPGCSIDQALGDGEDFELLFALSPDAVDGLLETWGSRFPDLELTAIGNLVPPGEGDSLAGGWEHFKNPR